ncbi:hypothetical protein EIN_023430 [Entamoeba invadens IP1]|uniref:hypothetical protein n=1 Tax=Entamoeba invadens IP1 TaxID=370355 RepID=UPI0002C3FB1F|nr:hypothetical protein EIN_023430 [Entamoeba invadens IP1]ELP90654.1 hypothetical protein EIN_023430 [Entamoeba invadens IP1]|eukprot:XP_004257425.1 hypothetical protein EIN_023430 [Entamoeba invadens IP1]
MDGTKVKNWTLSSSSVIYKADSKEGTQSIKITGTTKIESVDQNIPFEEGFQYQLCCYAKLTNNTKAFFQFSIEERADGKYVTGYYSQAYSRSNGWEQFCFKTPEIKNSSHTFDAMFYVHKDTSGVVLIDSVSATKVVAWLENVEVNSYRQEIEDSQKNFEVFIKHNASTEIKYTNFKMTVNILKNNVIKKTKTLDVTSQLISCTFYNEFTEKGIYVVVAELLYIPDNTKELVKTQFNRVSDKQRKYKFDKYGRVYENGKLTLPIGMYFSVITEEEMDLMNKTHITIMLPYNKPNIAMLDTMNTKYGENLKAVISVKDLYSYDLATCNKVRDYPNTEYKTLLNYLEMYKNHPNVFAWYVDDETPECGLDEMINLTMTVRDKDPNHPCYSVYFQYSKTVTFLPAFDAYGMDIYPVNQSTVYSVYFAQKYINDATMGRRSTWPAIQVLNNQAYEKQNAKYRAPTLQELRAMNWLSFIGGAKGVFYYSYFDLIRMNSTDPFEERWKDIVQSSDEVYNLQNVILSIEEPSIYSVEVETDKVVFTKRRVGNDDYFIVCNADEKSERTATIQLIGNGYQKVMGIGHEESVDGKLIIHLKPVDVFIIKFESSANQADSSLVQLVVLLSILLIVAF